MVLRKIMGLFVCALVIGSASFAVAGIPDVDLCTGTMPNMGAQTGVPVSLFVLPNGNGPGFDVGREIATGTVVDCTIVLEVLDGNSDPIPDYPFEDMWLEADGLVACVGGTTASMSTDGLGMTEWSLPPFAGGSSGTQLAGGDCWIKISGGTLPTPIGLAFTSADIDGNLDVDLQDIGFFTTAFFGAYEFRCDFYADGLIDLQDIGLLSGGLGAECN